MRVEMRKESEGARNPLSRQAFNLVKTSLMHECEKAILSLGAENYSSQPPATAFRPSEAPTSCTDCFPTKSFPLYHSPGEYEAPKSSPEFNANSPHVKVKSGEQDICGIDSARPSSGIPQVPTVHHPSNTPSETPPFSMHWTKPLVNPCSSTNFDSTTLSENCNLETRPEQNQATKPSMLTLKNSGNLVKHSRNLVAIMAKRTDSAWSEAQHPRAG